MNFKKLIDKAKDKRNFSDLKGYISFCIEYLTYISSNLQATIVSQNENNYLFYQYNQDGDFQITRPINSNLMYNAETFSKTSKEFIDILNHIKTINNKDQLIRKIITHSTYTIQQSIGATLDGLPAGQANTARKLNGDLFEHLIRLIIREIGVSCKSGVIQIPVILKVSLNLT